MPDYYNGFFFSASLLNDLFQQRRHQAYLPFSLPSELDDRVPN